MLSIRGRSPTFGRAVYDSLCGTLGVLFWGPENCSSLLPLLQPARRYRCPRRAFRTNELVDTLFPDSSFLAVIVVTLVGDPAHDFAKTQSAGFHRGCNFSKF